MFSLLRIPLCHSAVACGILGVLFSSAAPGDEAKYSSLVFPGPDGRLIYRPYTEEGDRIPDFSHCGYGGGGVPIPLVLERIALEPALNEQDDLPRLQAAVDELARQPADANGVRGAIGLRRGEYRLSNTLKISVGGIVLRGEGSDPTGTILRATGRRAHPLISVGGTTSREELPKTRQSIVTSYVPVGSRFVEVGDGSKFAAGDLVLVKRHGNASWIHEIKMNRIPSRSGDGKPTRQWKPFDLVFDRTVIAVRGNRIELDAPLACAIEERWGGGEVAKYDDRGRIQHVGVENLRAVSNFDPEQQATLRGMTYYSDERHANHLVSFDHVKNAWVRRVVALHFADGVATIGAGAKWLTVEDSSAVNPVSLITGGRRYPFQVAGQLILVQRCSARDARHAFAFAAHVPGPNVFLDCKSERDFATSEPHHRWSVGGLYDRVEAPIAIQDRQWLGTGHGWSGANYVVWNCTGSLICQKPPTAQNFAIGQIGSKGKAAFERPDGWWESQGRHVAPASLYLKQLEDRVGKAALDLLRSAEGRN